MNGDGDLDVLVTNSAGAHGQIMNNAMYINLGGGALRKQTEGAFVTGEVTLLTVPFNMVYFIYSLSMSTILMVTTSKLCVSPVHYICTSNTIYVFAGDIL